MPVDGTLLQEAMTRPTHLTCEHCGEPVTQPERGRLTSQHPECRDAIAFWRYASARIERAMQSRSSAGALRLATWLQGEVRGEINGLVNAYANPAKRNKR